MIDVEITYLEMFAPPEGESSAPPRDDLRIERVENPTVEYYRYLYGAVGESWQWYDLHEATDAEVAKTIQDPLVELFGGYGVTWWYGHRNAYLFFDSGTGDTLETTALGTHLSRHLRRFYDTTSPATARRG